MSNPTETRQGNATGSNAATLFSRWNLVRLLIPLAAIGAACLSIVFVDETEYAIVERLGVIVAVYDRLDPISGDRGPHFKLPWPIDTVRRFDRRLQLFDPPGREMFTSDRKNIVVDSFVCWKIAEPPTGAELPLSERPVVRFFRGLGNNATAEARLDTRVRSILSSELGKLELGQLLGVANSEAGPSGPSPLEDLSRRVLEDVKQRGDERESLQQRLGVEVVDIGVKRINLPEANLFAVYERMRTEREKIAQRYRSEGEAEKLLIESQARRQSEEILAKAGAKAEGIRGSGEAEAIAIRNRAYARDPEFYKVMRTLESYKKILNQKTTIVLSASSSLLKLLTDGPPQDSGTVPSVISPASGPAPAPLRDSGAGTPADSAEPGTAKPQVGEPK